VTQAGTQPPPTDTSRELADLVREVFEGEHSGHLDAETLQSALASLLAAYPDAPIAAIRDDGVVVAMPSSVGLQRNPVLEARSALDLVVYDEQVLSGWDRVLTTGAAVYAVHPVSNPELTGTVYGLDLRERHGVIVTVSVFAQSEDAGPLATGELPEVTPRFASVRKDARSFLSSVDVAMTQILGWSAEEMEGHRSIEFIHPDDHALAIDNWMQMLAAPGPARRVRLRHRRRDDSWVWLEVTNHNLLNDPDHHCVISEMVDISEEMSAHEALKAREQLLDGLAEAVPVGLLQVDAERRVVYTNDRLHEILGVELMEEASAQMASVSCADQGLLEETLDRVLGDGQQSDIEVELRRPPSGELRFCTVSLRALRDAGGAIHGAIACVADITDGAHMREELERRATFDELTGCYNRASIMRALEVNIASGQRHAERAVVFVDLDGFKAVNDCYGHAAGDELLKIVAERLRAAVRDGDIVGRLGGDEFLVVCPDVGGPDEAMKLAERLARSQRTAVDLTDAGVTALVSIGVAWSAGASADAYSIVAQADDAMYASKREGAGRPKLATVDAPSRGDSLQVGV
jgi:diguanylate cyclase (GGDEF)-like protein/PAS domain S-box-containing protein